MGADRNAPTSAEEQLSVAELAARSGVKVPTIHYYRRLGLLPEPVRVDEHRFRYSRRHVQALRLIRLLRERRRLPLTTIGEVLPALLAADQEAFRPEMWDEVVAAHLDSPADQPEQQLVAVAREAFAARGFGAVSIEELCAEAGLAKGSFYRFFGSKKELYLTALRSIPDAVAADLPEHTEPVVDDVLAAELGAAVAPFTAFLLEGLVRALHGEADHDAAMVDVVDRLAEVVTDKAGPDADPLVGDRLVGPTLQRQIETTLGMSPIGG